MNIEFSGKIWFWRGPAPWFFVTVPEAHSRDLSEGTVRNHISTAIQKLNGQNRMEAAHLAKEKGWL